MSFDVEINNIRKKIDDYKNEGKILFAKISMLYVIFQYVDKNSTYVKIKMRALD